MDWTHAHHLLIFGGSFDPPHRAHTELPEQVRQALDADAVLYIPAARSPHKLDQQPSPSHHRLRMLELALGEYPHACILTDELDRAQQGEPTYTVDTLKALRESVEPSATLRLLIGTDQALAFDRWREPDRIVELAEPLVMLRAPETAESFLKQFATPQQRATWERRIVPVDAMNISASGVRKRVAENQPIDALVPGPVARYIREHSLYR